MKNLAKIIFILSISMSLANAQNWKPTAALVSFKTKMLGLAVNGTFKNLATTLVFDPNNLATANITAVLDAKTINTDNSLRDKHLKEKEEFFDVVKYPTIKMKSIKITKENGDYVGIFELTIKDVSKNIKVPFSFEKNSSNGTFKSSFVINRKDWKVGGSTFGMATDVTINITLNAETK